LERLLNPTLAILEILFVALAGSLVAASLFALSSQTDPLSSSLTFFSFVMVEAIFTLLAITLLLRLSGESYAGIGLRLVNARRELLIGLLVVPILFLTTQIVVVAFRLFLPQFVSIENPLLDLIKTRVDLLLFLITGVFVGGLKEEVQRAYVINRFGTDLGGRMLGVIVWSVFFGLMHSAQGIDRATAAGVLGLIFGLLYLNRRNLVAPICAHAVYDIAVILLAWWLGDRL